MLGAALAIDQFGSRENEKKIEPDKNPIREHQHCGRQPGGASQGEPANIIPKS